MNDDVEGRGDLAAAAQVHAARRAIDDAIAGLAARPLDEAAADRMRSVLAEGSLEKARAALQRLSNQRGPSCRPTLTVVASAAAAVPAPDAQGRAVGGVA